MTFDFINVIGSEFKVYKVYLIRIFPCSTLNSGPYDADSYVDDIEF